MAFVSSHLLALITSLNAANARSFTWLQKLGTESLRKEKSIKAVEKEPCCESGRSGSIRLGEPWDLRQCNCCWDVFCFLSFISFMLFHCFLLMCLDTQRFNSAYKIELKSLFLQMCPKPFQERNVLFWFGDGK